MTFALLVLAGLVLGTALATALFRLAGAGGARDHEDDAAAVLDRLCASGVCALVVWVATSWALAAAHLLRAAPLVAASLLELAAGAAWLYRSRDAMGRTYRMMPRATLAATCVALAPVGLWVAFVFWRGSVLPPYNHDALAYHLPKAVLLLREGGYRFFDVPETRIATWPWNYELLLADSIILTGGDHLTAAVSTFAFVLFALLAARIAAVWWGGGAHVALVTGVVTSTPIAVLHSGLHKNDLLFSVLALGALSWGGRWLAAGCLASAVLAILTLGLAVGTKLTAAVVVPPVLALLVVGARRHRAGAREWRLALSAAAAALAFGAGSYVTNLVHLHRPFLSPNQQGVYGAWSNFWEFPPMLVIAPFANGNHGAVWNVVHHAYYWWPENDVWTSNWGAILSLLLVVLVPCIWRYRRDGASRVERTATSLGTLFTFLAILPVDGVPHGFFNQFPRYTLFAIPIVAAWTISPALLELGARAGRFATAASLLAAAGVAAFGARSLYVFGLHDAYAPLDYVAHVLDHPDDRIPFVRRNRAGSVLDVLAAPGDTCAFDVDFDGWIYPAYGARWTRNVELLRPAAGDVTIPDDADWVAVDRSWNVFFGHPKFVDMSRAYWLGRGKPTDDDLKVYRQLSRDPRFELVYDDRVQNQAVFHRKAQPAWPGSEPSSSP
jgi:hypothetical protein